MAQSAHFSFGWLASWVARFSPGAVAVLLVKDFGFSIGWALALASRIGLVLFCSVMFCSALFFLIIFLSFLPRCSLRTRDVIYSYDSFQLWLHVPRYIFCCRSGESPHSLSGRYVRPGSGERKTEVMHNRQRAVGKVGLGCDRIRVRRFCCGVHSDAGQRRRSRSRAAPPCSWPRTCSQPWQPCTALLTSLEAHWRAPAKQSKAGRFSRPGGGHRRGLTSTVHGTLAALSDLLFSLILFSHGQAAVISRLLALQRLCSFFVLHSQAVSWIHQPSANLTTASCPSVTNHNVQ
ncbi:hypothetical protein B0T24DRAFT_183232 [Lasiosphaeria ovina]|uniref:Uncharacterized protein n=1 Tax=Lasiosphaeria ovina TaxID=92902 RepID=A0AAE0NEN7_9PEZI|nr:hypothetical protein B0T24DRAFT_183232 [Lasiosphaeria ovina]